MHVDDNLREFVAGTVGGWAQVVVGHPFDTVKVRLQTQPDPPRFRGGLDCVRITIQEEGARGLYKGVMSPMTGIGICNAVLFTANGYFRRVLRGDQPLRTLSLAEMTAAGGASGLVMAFVNCPVELLKVRLQVQYSSASSSAPSSAISKEPYKGVYDCGRRTLAESGVRGLYRGITATILRDAPSFAAYFGTYEAAKRQICKRHADGQEQVLDQLLAGGLAGIGAWLVCFPQDVIKSRMQSNPKYKTTAECVRALVQQNGTRISGYFKGFGPTILRAFPANAATFVAYEWTMKALLHDPTAVVEPIK